MPLLLTQADLQPLLDSSRFHSELFRVIEEALLQEQGTNLGHAAFLKFPLGAEGRAVQIYPLSSPSYGAFVRIAPVSESSTRPTSDSDMVVHLDRETGMIVALLATDDLSPLRTAAPIGVACKYLAPSPAHTLALLGTGIQARYQLQVIHAAVPSLKTVRVFSRAATHREDFVRAMGATTDLTMIATDSAREAVEGADIVCVAAGGREPILTASWVRPGALITIINPTAISPDFPVRVVVPSLEGPEVRPSGWEPHPPYSMAANGGRVPDMIATTLRDVMRQNIPARKHADEVVLYVQLGAAVWDAALLHWIYVWAKEHDRGTMFHLTSL